MNDMNIELRKIILLLLIMIIAFIPLIYYPSNAYTDVKVMDDFSVKIPKRHN
ncbi:MAG: hypothetical protein U5K53_07755 [Halanaerobiales bacterium]|nr:hypothetical protein [Halanaerobiales bacterium]